MPGFLDRFLGKTETPTVQTPEVATPREPEKKELVLGLSDSLGKFMQLGVGSASTASAALGLYESSSAVAIPIGMIVDPFRSMKPILQIDGKNIEIGDPRAEVIRFLRRPSPHFSQQLFLETYAKDFLITGESFLVALGNVNRPPLELQPLSPKVITLPEGTGGVPSRYIAAGNTLAGEYSPEQVKRDIRYYDGFLREMWHTRNYSTKTNSLLRGQSKLNSAAKDVRQHVLGGEHNVSLLERGGRISLIFHFDSDLDEDKFEELKDRVRAQYGGPQKAGEIGVTTGGKLDIKEAGMNSKDMDFAILQQMAQRAIALQYRVPLPLISDKNMTLGNYAEGKLALYDDAVIPLANVLFGSLGEFLLPRYGLDPARAEITFDPNAIPALVKRRNEEVKLRADIGVETHDELRMLLSQPPLAEGGDQVYISATMIPLGSGNFLDNDEEAGKTEEPEVVDD